MANTLKLEIVTPDATVYSEDVDMVTLPGVEGQMGILPQHVPLMTQMVPGEMIVPKGGREDFLAVGEGLVEITGTSRHPDRHGHCRREHRRSQGRRSASTRRRPPPREALRRRSRFRQRLPGPLAGAIARQAPPPHLIGADSSSGVAMAQMIAQVSSRLSSSPSRRIPSSVRDQRLRKTTANPDGSRAGAHPPRRGVAA